MSLQVNLSAPGIRQAYEGVLSGSSDYLILTYDRGLSSNDLKVQESGSGSLEDVAEGLSDGRMQYAFARVTDANSGLPKFVLVNWCGEGVPESRKGLFASHAAEVARFFRTAHVTVQARTEADVEPALILRKVADSGGAKYAAAGSAANTARHVPIAPVGSSYKPVGAPDIRGIQQAATPAKEREKDTIAPVGSAYKPIRNELADIRAKSSSNAPAAPAAPPPASRPSQFGASNNSTSTSARSSPSVAGLNSGPVVRGPSFGGSSTTAAAGAARGGAPSSSSIKTAPASAAADFEEDDDGDDFAPSKRTGGAGAGAGAAPSAPAAPAAPAPPASAPPSASSAAAAAAAAAVPQKPAADERIGPVGTAYTPVALPKPGKLALNRFPFGGKQDEAGPPAPGPSLAKRNAVAAASGPASGFGSSGASGAGGAGAGATPGKLTWSQRQEAAKAEREREEAASKGSIEKSKSAIGAAVGLGAGAGAAAGIRGAAAAARREEDAEEEEQEEEQAPPPPPPPPAPPAPPAAAREEEEVSKHARVCLRHEKGNAASHTHIPHHGTTLTTAPPATRLKYDTGRTAPASAASTTTCELDVPSPLLCLRHVWLRTYSSRITLCVFCPSPSPSLSPRLPSPLTTLSSHPSLLRSAPARPCPPWPHRPAPHSPLPRRRTRPSQPSRKGSAQRSSTRRPRRAAGSPLWSSTITLLKMVSLRRALNQ